MLTLSAFPDQVLSNINRLGHITQLSFLSSKYHQHTGIFYPEQTFPNSPKINTPQHFVTSRRVVDSRSLISALNRIALKRLY